MVSLLIMWIIANWKSNKTIAEALDWLAQAGPKIPKNPNLTVVVCPCFSALSEVKKAIIVGNFPLLVGAQDLSPFGMGAYTGEEPAQILRELITHAILGHSERRQNFGETDEIISQKAAQAKANNITPLICVQGTDILIPQDCELVAFEPISAIGTGNPDTPENANEVAKTLKEKNGQDIQVLYGGSVTADNVQSFLTQSFLSGVMIGKASLDVQEFIKICKKALENI
ncbi:triosephosphate isomerase [Candidatus Daviesbacteria bacterium]|nr:triosephosphate isomerase [Candidatus Daviesbacteria bacterium]